MSKEWGINTQKVLLLLEAGLALGLSGSPTTYFKILKAAGKEWQEIEKRALRRAIKNLYQSKLVDLKQDKNKVLIMKINDKGKEKILKYKLENMKVPQMKKWDKKWRVILFDIPEFKRKLRDSLRMHLKNLGFFEFQKSVFVHPFECENEINFLIEFYNIRPNVRFMVADYIDNELHLRKHFNLL